jgi:hypothetical protein
MGGLEETTETPEHEDAELVSEIRKNLKNHAAAFSGWRKKARESYDFVASEQWTDEEKSKLEESMRTPIVFNRVARTINAVIGLELQNRQEVSYKPISTGATGVTDLMNCAAKWTRSNCDAEDEESEAFFDTLVCGIGATETLMDYSQDLDGMAIVERIDPFECAADHLSKKRNFDDARWVARWKSYNKDEFEKMYPGVEPEGGDLISWGADEDEVDHNDDEYKHGNPEPNNEDRTYTIVKYQYYKEETVHRVLVNGELRTLSPDEYAAVKEQLDVLGIQSAEQKKRKYCQVLICRDTVLEQTDAPIDGFTIRFITGLRDRNRNIWFGLVELMKDPQRWANKWLSQIQYIINSNAKGGLLYEANTFTNPKKAKAQWAKPNEWIEVVKGALTEGRVRDRTAPQYPDGIDRLLQQALTAINDVPGVNVEMLGIANRNQPGVIEDSRKEAGVTILASFFDSLRRYRKEQGRVLMSFILNYISDGRLIRLDGANAQYVPLLRDQLAAKYDIIVDDAPTSANMKEKTFGAISQILPIALQSGIPIPPEVLEYSPLPSQLTEKWMKLIQEQKAGDPEKEEMKQTISQMAEQLKAAVSELEDKTEETAVKAKGNELKHQADMRNADIKAYEAETERMRLEKEPAPAEESGIPKGLQVTKTPDLMAEEALRQGETMDLLGQVASQISQPKDDSALIAVGSGIIDAVQSLVEAVSKPKSPVYDQSGQIIRVE